MASRIQGITVEIGGDTTKLSSALHPISRCVKITHKGGHNRNGKEELFKLYRLLQPAS